MIIPKKFIKLCPFLVFSIKGSSMEPSFKTSEKIFALSSWLISIHKNDVVIALDPRSQIILIKRVSQVKKGKYFLIGDNKKESTDSRNFGWIEKRNILAKVIYPQKVYNS